MKGTRLALIIGAALAAGCANTVERDLAWEVKPHVDVRHGMRQAQAQYRLGRYFQGQGRLPLAERAYREALVADPAHVDAINALASLLAARGELEDASRLFERLLAQAPSQAYLHNNAGYALYLQGRHAEAVARLRTAVVLAPDFERAWVNLENAARAAGRTDLVAMAQQRGEPNRQGNGEAVTTPVAADVVSLTLARAVPAFPHADRRVLASATERSAPEFVPPQAVAVRETPVPPALPVVASQAKDSARTVLSATADLWRAEAVESPARSAQTPGVAGAGLLPLRPTLLRVGLSAPAVTIDARLEISNANGVRHFASEVGARLKSAGLDVRRVNNYETFALAESKVEYRRGYEDQARALASRLGLDVAVVRGEAERWGSDVRLILGADVIGAGRIRT
ncbi:MAG: tetratricopeptide repeat protein [Rhodocyclaceae bacterium]|nr:tetratricopeptide repeat protein [Rhodocyclaceae bacterium]